MNQPRRPNGRLDRLRRAYQAGQAAAANPGATPPFTKAEHRAEWHRGRCTRQWAETPKETT